MSIAQLIADQTRDTIETPESISFTYNVRRDILRITVKSTKTIEITPRGEKL
jgi:hypothetical protein